MIRSLRARLIAATAAVLGAVLTALLLFSSRMTRVEVRRFEDVVVMRGRAAPAASARILEAHYRQAGGWRDADAAARRAAELSGREVVALDPAGRVVARSRALERTRVEPGPDGGLRIEWPGKPPRIRQFVLVRVPFAALSDPQGRPIGRVYELALPSGAVAPNLDLSGSINRWLAGGIAAAGIVALLVIAATSRRILGPIEKLTAAARSMELGDRGVRVPAGADDELGELARSFNSMADAIAGAEALRRNLVTDVAHELRTPLTNIRAQLEALQDGLLPPDSAVIDSLHDDALLLERLVDDLQDLALAEAGQLALRLESVDAGEALERAAAAARTRAAEAGVAIEVLPGAGAAATADRERLAQMLANLVTNSLAHTSAGGRIALSAARSGASVEFSVSDTGGGIPAEHLPHVFERFYRSDPSRSRTTGGSGLGLAIVKHLALAQSGSARVESEVGRGTVVFLTLPAAPS
ncbi:MAG: ATP-binding protein [Acidobacteriota bacterium]